MAIFGMELHTEYSKRHIKKTLNDFVKLQKKMCLLQNCKVYVRDSETGKLKQSGILGNFMPKLPQDTRRFWSD